MDLFSQLDQGLAAAGERRADSELARRYSRDSEAFGQAWAKTKQISVDPFSSFGDALLCVLCLLCNRSSLAAKQDSVGRTLCAG